jgi:hypothetical protein
MSRHPSGTADDAVEILKGPGHYSDDSLIDRFAEVTALRR